MSTNVLVADDEAGMRDTLVDILEGAGYQVQSAADGAAALALVQGERFDVVVMDVRMPHMSGVEVLGQLGPPPPRVVLMTAYALDDQLREARRHNVFAILQKPFPVPFLLQVVADASGP